VPPPGRRGSFSPRPARPRAPSRGGPPPGPRAGPSPRRPGRRRLEKSFADGPMVRRGGGGVGVLKVIQEFSQAAWISQKEPAHHRLKSCGLSVQGTVLVSRSTCRPIASAAHEAFLAGPQVGPEPFESRGLGVRPHPRHHLIVEIVGAAGGLAVAQPLVQLPNGVAEPGELQDVEIGLGGQGGQGIEPVSRAGCGPPGTGGGLRRRAGQGRWAGRAGDGGTPPASPA
jgi:hypothetical protein